MKTKRKARPRRRTPAGVRRTAYHEAGHAVIGRVLGLVCGDATIVPDFEEMVAGVAIIRDQFIADDAWEMRGKFRCPVSAMRGRIMTVMAGAEAERVAFGRSGGGDRHDQLQIALMAEDQNISFAYSNRLRPKVRALLRRHWRKIEQVAQALLRARTLTAVEIDALIEQVTQQNEREVAARIKLARKPLRDEYARVHETSLRDQAKW